MTTKILNNTKWLVIAAFMLLSNQLAWASETVGPTTISLTSGWTNSSGASYCGGYGKNTGWYVSDYNITALSTVLSNASNSNFSLTIRVKALCNQSGSGYVNSLSVVLLNSSGSTVGAAQTNTSLPNGTASSAAQWKEFTFTPTSAVTGYKIYGGKLCAVYSTEYTLTYDAAPACSNSVTIQKGAETNGTFTLSKSGAQASCDGVSVTVSATPATNYYTSAVTESGASASPTITGSGNSWTVAYGANTTGTSTISVTFTQKTLYTVTWNVEGTDLTGLAPGLTSVYSGDQVTGVPSTPVSSCSGTFIGWTTSANAVYDKSVTDAYTTDPSASLFTTSAGSPVITANTTFYAVFKKRLED